MDFTLNSWGDIATFSAVLAAVLGVVAWLVRTWINQAVSRMGDEIKPHLTNDETSVAKYAHDARDAARESAEQIAIVHDDLRDLRTEVRDLNHLMIEHVTNRNAHHQIDTR